MKTDIFTISEIITIVMDLVDKLKTYELYGFEDESELHIPKPINDKLESLDFSDYNNFISKCSEIAEEILSIKTGELNELNYCHEQITFLAEDMLKSYIRAHEGK
ncbi:hypothetical protein [Clostridium uliginosum]|uniref:Uncharacterized protein n=1 Tax=Clostridium uliginosum TaxID=119641 RepID=A0A1I1MU67_9CLOT|nr:hypothetical protein [Clostridium uliginosum]SFC88911.1 hypothetical protein SAMN05421842_11253 [Clostridium uliginosum]